MCDRAVEQKDAGFPKNRALTIAVTFCNVSVGEKATHNFETACTEQKNDALAPDDGTIRFCFAF